MSYDRTDGWLNRIHTALMDPSRPRQSIGEMVAALIEYRKENLISKRATDLEVEVEALAAKVASLSPHGTCACSYDKPDDVCGHHSPALAAANARIVELEAALKPFVEAYMYNISGEDELWKDHHELWESPVAMALTAGDLRRAARASKGGER